MAGSNREIVDALQLRGFRVVSHSGGDNLPFSLDLQEPFLTRLYDAMKRYSFRLFMRDVIQRKAGFSASQVCGYSSHTTASKYIKVLLTCGLVERKGSSQYRLVSDRAYSFGDSLAWLVAEVLRREFGCPSLWNVRLTRSRAGGDYDVLALTQGHLVYLEVKSSPPKHIEQKEVAAFLTRVQALAPQCAVFLEDTQLRMKDKIVPFFEAELPRFWKQKGLPVSHPQRKRREIFVAGSNCFITNSHPDLVRNIGFCISSYLHSTGGLKP